MRSSGGANRVGYSYGWPAYAAFCVGFLFVLVNLYWLLGGELGLNTVGGSFAEATRRGAPLVVSGTIVKVLGAVFALALVRPWGTLFSRRLLTVLGWLGTALLVLYGGVLTVGAALVEVGVVSVKPADPVAFRGHLYLWDPWFLVWGILLGMAMVRFARSR